MPATRLLQIITAIAAMCLLGYAQVGVAQHDTDEPSASVPRPKRLVDHHIWHKTVGRGRPILFLHGWTMDHRDEELDYEPIFAHRSGWKRIYIDLPAMGNSRPRRVDDQDSMLQAVIDFIDAELPGERLVVAGTSAGGYLARGLAHRRKDRIAGVLLRMPLVVPADGSRDVDPTRVLLANEEVLATLPARRSQEHRRTIVQTPSYIEALNAKMSTRVEPAQALADRRTLDPIRNDPKRYAFSFEVDAAGPVIESPTLIITGRQDSSVGYRDAWRLTARFPRATFAALDRAEHGFPIDRQNRVLFEALVNDWLDRIEEMGPNE